uniref:nuclear transport factor 2 family protein n=1 Tax=Ningiella ruwaisensis TaxID=2364274 RepID=UPI001445ADA1|nr:nuclear transport factor 2 family protein [Ningiella ruwaisensis]
MRQPLITLLFSISLSLAAFYAMSENKPESFTTPEDAINAYITGVTTGSGDHVMSAFSEHARIQYYNQNDRFMDYTRDNFAADVDKGDNWDAEVKISNLQITGKAANAKIDFTWGEKAEHGYVDYLNLIQGADGWRITNKVAQYIKRSPAS